MSNLRLMVHDVWNHVTLPFGVETSLHDLKLAALRESQITATPDEFLLKYLGAEIDDESIMVGEAGIPDSATLIVTRRRRRAVR